MKMETQPWWRVPLTVWVACTRKHEDTQGELLVNLGEITAIQENAGGGSVLRYAGSGDLVLVKEEIGFFRDVMRKAELRMEQRRLK